jgi:NhaP-type Na+/H+ or K+/H+ antiporter
MDLFVLFGLLVGLVAVDWAITRSGRRRDEWAFWEDWNFFVYGPLFVLLCLALTVDAWLHPEWSPSARLPMLLGLPLVVVYFASRWYRYCGRRLRGLLSGRRDTSGPDGRDQGPDARP